MSDDIVSRLWQYTPEAPNAPMETRLLLNDAANEIERLRGAIDLVIQAIENEGPVPKYHRELMGFHVREWPTLWRAIYNLKKVRNR